MTPIREHVRQLVEAGYTQTQISKLSTVPQGTISRILNGDCDPRSSTADLLRQVELPKRHRVSEAA